jgi:glyoxylase-like metal-dependent hydrolase (beta-lactamase superfamily II)
MRDDVWEIIAVRCGRMSSTKGALYHRFSAYEEPDAPQDMDYFFYVLFSPAGRITLVDCGFSVEEVGRRPGRETVVTVAEALARLGVDPGTVTDLIVTHFHWDHIGNLDLFDGADIFVPGTELAFWESATSRQPQFVEHTSVAATQSLLDRHRRGELRVLGKNCHPLPGVATIEVGGHAPGQQILQVDTTAGPVVLASDAVHLYEELEQERPFGILVDLEQMYDAYSRLKRMQAQGALIVPGHDPDVRNRFPTVEGASAGVAYRIARQAP